MEILVNNQRKNQITRAIIKYTPALHTIQIIVRLLIIVSLITSIFYLLFGLFNPTSSLVTVQGVEQKNYFSIIKNTLLIAVIGIVLSIFAHFLLGNLSSKDVNERANEAMLIDSNMIRYTFRTRYQSAPDSRIVFIIPFADITSIIYDDQLSKITLRGRFSSDVVDNYENAPLTVPSSGNQSEIVIYDYFEPSLQNVLSERRRDLFGGNYGHGNV